MESSVLKMNYVTVILHLFMATQMNSFYYKNEKSFVEFILIILLYFEHVINKFSEYLGTEIVKFFVVIVVNFTRNTINSSRYDFEIFEKSLYNFLLYDSRSPKIRQSKKLCL